MAAADVALSDHSSLCLYHFLLKHPVLLVPVSSKQYMPNSLFSILQKVTPSTDNYATLRQGINDIVNNDIPFSYNEIIEKMLSYQGVASKIYSSKILSMIR